MQSKVLEYTTFIAFRDNELTNFSQKVLTHLYMPLIGSTSINIYTTLATLIDSSNNESLPISHLKLFQMLRIEKESDFIKEREKLEAVGLIDIFENEQNLIYKLKQPLNPIEFFNNEILNTFLQQMVSEDIYQGLLVEFLMHRFNLGDYNMVTKSFDDVFTIDNQNTVNYANELKTLITTSSGNEVLVKNPHFDYQYLMMLLETIDIIDKEYINSRDFYNLVNRCSFMYQLTTEEIKDAILESTNINREIDIEVFKRMCKLSYDKHPNKYKIKVAQTDNQNNNKLINYLEQASPTEIVKTMFKVGLASTEIEMFDKLLDTTGISIGLLNVLIIYVLKEKKGMVPSYNYFDKILKGWQRMGITSALEAMDYINGRTPQNTKSKGFSRQTKNLPSWYGEYAKSMENPNQPSSSEQDNNSLLEIEELFKFEEK